jgi:hypothetical protein
MRDRREVVVSLIGYLLTVALGAAIIVVVLAH